jgi:hypothetical protein
VKLFFLGCPIDVLGENIWATSLLGFNFPRNLHVGLYNECHAA